MINIYNRDCLSTMKKIKNNSVDLILTDPPYNLGNFMRDRDFGVKRMRDNTFVTAGWDDLEYNEWLEQMNIFFRQADRVLKKRGSMIVFMSIIKVESIIKLAQKNGFYYKTTGIWHKTNPMPRNMNLHFVNSTEAWVYFVTGAKTGTFNNNGKLLHDFYETSLTPSAEKKYGKHPTQKPEELFEHFVSVLTDENDTVLDPFMGTGTAGVVSAKLNRNFIGMEIDKTYYQITQKRINEVSNILDNDKVVQAL
ncbi:MAG: DNA-methyltransferase [bacterium]